MGHERSPDVIFSGPITAAASAKFSRDGNLIVASSERGGLQTWDATASFDRSSDGVARSPLQSFNEARGEPLRGVRTAEFSLDGKRVLTSSNDGKARLWDAKSGAKVITFVGHSGVVSSAHFDVRGSRVVTASSDRTARVWDAASGSEVLQLLGSGGDIYGARLTGTEQGL